MQRRMSRFIVALTATLSLAIWLARVPTVANPTSAPVHRVTAHGRTQHTRDNSASINNSVRIGVVGGLCVLVIAVLLLIRRHDKATDDSVSPRENAREREIQRIAALMSVELAPIAAPSLAKRNGENVYWKREGVQQYAESRSVHSRGMAASVRVAPGLYLRPSDRRTRNESAMQLTGVGTLYATDQRIVFIGERGTTVIATSAIVSVERFNDGIKLNRENAMPVIYVTGWPDDGVIIARVVSREFAAT